MADKPKATPKNPYEQFEKPGGATTLEAPAPAPPPAETIPDPLSVESLERSAIMGAPFLDPPVPVNNPRTYKPDADPVFIKALELYERIHDGSLMLPHAYSASIEVYELIPLLRERLIQPEQPPSTAKAEGKKEAPEG